MSTTQTAVALTISGQYSIDRTNKAGTRTVTRDAIGVLMSGNKDERIDLVKHVLTGIWSQEQEVVNFHPILNNIVRVFPEAAPWLRTVRDQKFPSKELVYNAFESVALLTGRNGAALKGEKGMVVQYCAMFVEQYKAQVAAKEARRIEFEAKKAAEELAAKIAEENRTVDVETTEVPAVE